MIVFPYHPSDPSLAETLIRRVGPNVPYKKQDLGRLDGSIGFHGVRSDFRLANHVPSLEYLRLTNSEIPDLEWFEPRGTLTNV